MDYGVHGDHEVIVSVPCAGSEMANMSTPRSIVHIRPDANAGEARCKSASIHSRDVLETPPPGGLMTLGTLHK